MKKSIIIGTRGSELALWQAHFVQSQLKSIGQESSLHIIKTKGDQIQDLSFDKIEGKGFFTKEIEEALLNGEIDLAVHSHKDLETEQPEGLTIGAVSERADAADVLLILPSAVHQQEKYQLKKNAIVGTSSARRKALMLHYRNDVELKDLRGNLPTRIQKLRDGQYDAILLAKAGIDRLAIDLNELIQVQLSPEEFVPAPAQGVLALQCRINDTEVLTVLQKIDRTDVREIIGIERTVLRKMEGGCHLPLGVFAMKGDEEFEVHVAFARTWDSPLRNVTFISNNAEALPGIIVSELQKFH